MAKINIDNVEYDFDKLSEETKAQLIAMQFCDQELQRLHSQAAALQTARQAYAKALQASLAAEATQGETLSFN